MVYNWSDLKQTAIGSFTAIIVFFAIRGDNPFFFDATKGLIITGILIYIYYNGFKMKNKDVHFCIDIVIAFAVSAWTAHTFGLIAYEQIFSYEVFGSLVIVGVWVAIARAIIFDRYDIVNPMRGYYVRGK